MKPIRSLVLFSMLMISMGSSAQLSWQQKTDKLNHSKVDSLKMLVLHAPDDTLKIIRLIMISELQIDFVDVDISYSEEALKLATKLHFTKAIPRALIAKGFYYQSKKDYKSAIKIYRQALDFSEKDGINRDNEGSYSTLLNMYFYTGDYPNAMEIISRELGVSEKLDDKKRIAHCLNVLGYIYFKQGNFIESEKKYQSHINISRELNDSVMLAHALGELSDVYIQQEKYKQAIDTLKATISICDQLRETHNKIINSTTEYYPIAVQYKAKALYRLSKTYKLMGENTSALKYAMEGNQYINQYPITLYDISSFYINTGEVYLHLHDFPSAIAYLDSGMNIAKKIQHRENIRDAAEIISQTYAAEKRYDSAFSYYQLFSGLKDSIVNNETRMKIAGIQGQYDIAKKDKLIEREQQIRNVLIGSFLFFLIIVILIYNGYRLKQKNQYQRSQNQQQIELFNAIVNTQDQERKRIAQDIHDSLGSVLSAAKLKISALEESKQLFTPDQLQKYTASMALLDEASTELRNISHNIMPASLSKLGIVAALQSLIGSLSSDAGIQINFTTHGLDSRMEENMEISIYRIILELINNIMKHAHADKATIQLIRYPGYINVTVEDNGRGFNMEKIREENRGIGLGNVYSRVKYLKGSINFDSMAGKGTTVFIEIPV